MSDLLKEIGKWAIKSANQTRIKAMVEQAVPYLPKSIKDFDSNPMKLTVLNGTLDLTTGTLLPHSPDDFMLGATDSSRH